MTPEKWQAAGLLSVTTLSLVILATHAMRRAKADGITYLRVGLILFVGFLLMSFFFPALYVEAPVLVGVRVAMVSLAATFMAVGLTRRLE